MKVKITEAAKWHVKGDIIDENPVFEKVSDDYFKRAEAKIEVKEEKKTEEVRVQSQVTQENSMDRMVIANDIDDKDRKQKLVIIFGLILIIIGLTMIKF